MTTPKLLTKKQLQALEKSLAYFITTEKKLTGTFPFENHVEALVFIARITVYAEVANHHPDIQFTYKKVKISLTTHDAKGVTQNDGDLAKKIEVLYRKYGDKKE